MWTVAGRTATSAAARSCADFCREVHPHVLPLHTRHTLHRHRLTMGQSIFAMDWEEVRDGGTAGGCRSSSRGTPP